ncbi:hypothetical protein CR152_10470 [Massilia violaceinigra]|uniref:Uncharacterized protein n=1 Tax=Massilia violaceinigra TaxID=2045208 RepID=A0A2D2DIW2_9BURK|nr:hypothetical protein [Massilia violaceinigra]ATQ74901.1 hypothetical protein CR152_10470 [Massilia violaceinigra]
MRFFLHGLIVLLIAGSSHAADLPNAHQLTHRKNYSVVFLDDYNLGKINLACTLPTGVPVGIVLVSDTADFRFVAVKLPQGAAILANQHELKRAWVPYAVYSFYRECALHVMSKVTATGIDDADNLTMSLSRAAECLAVIPTLNVFSNPKDVSLSRISFQLKDEYGERVGSSPAELERCRNPKFSADVATKEMKKR